MIKGKNVEYYRSKIEAEGGASTFEETVAFCEREGMRRAEAIRCAVKIAPKLWNEMRQSNRRPNYGGGKPSGRRSAPEFFQFRGA